MGMDLHRFLNKFNYNSNYVSRDILRKYDMGMDLYCFFKTNSNYNRIM